MTGTVFWVKLPPLRGTSYGLDVVSVMEISIVGTGPSAPKYALNVPTQGRWGIGDVAWRKPRLGPFSVYVAANLHYPLPWRPRHFRLLQGAHIESKLISVVAFRSLSPEAAESQVSRGLSSWREAGIDFYDSVHTAGRPCRPVQGCCIVAATLEWPTSIQARLSNLIHDELNLSMGASVAVHAFGLAVLQRPERINLIGIDLPRSRKDYRYFGRWDWRYRPTPWITSDLRHDLRDLVLRGLGRRDSIFAPDFESLLWDFAQIGRVCRAIGTEVRVLSDSSNLPSRFGA